MYCTQQYIYLNIILSDFISSHENVYSVLLTDKAQGSYICIVHNYIFTTTSLLHHLHSIILSDFISSYEYVRKYINIYILVCVYCTFRPFIGEEVFYVNQAAYQKDCS